MSTPRLIESYDDAIAALGAEIATCGEGDRVRLSVWILEHKITSTGWRLHFLRGHNGTGNGIADAVVPAIERAMNEEYLRDLSVKTVRGLVDKVKAGGVVGGKIPYGYRKRITYPDGTHRLLDRRTKHRKQRDERASWSSGTPRRSPWFGGSLAATPTTLSAT